MLFSWLLRLSLSFTTGALLVYFLTVHPLQMSRYAVAVTLSFAATLRLLWTRFDSATLLAAIPLALAAALVGYVLLTRHVLAREDPRQLPELTRAVGDPGSGHTAVIYFTHGEPETYDPIGWINQFKEFDEQNIPFVPLVARPMFLYRLRRGYLEVGRSEHRRMHQRMLQELERAFRANL